MHGKLTRSAEQQTKKRDQPQVDKKEGSWFSALFSGGGGGDAGSGGGGSGGAGGSHGHGGGYMYGGPGCGKTFCMDLAYACLPGTDGVDKKREHFHSFMLATHHALHKLGKSGGDSSRDTVALYASEIAKTATVLCLDEFQVTDVADAMIIRRLLDQLWARGVTLVTTSNRAPDDLYKNGLNRVQFVPCIEGIKARCVVHPMESERDYRLTGTKTKGGGRIEEEEISATAGSGSGSSSSSSSSVGDSGGADEAGDTYGLTWKVATDAAAGDEWLSRRLRRLTKAERMVSVEIAMAGRRIHVSKAAAGVAHLHFDEVCASALGAGDYTALASVFHTVGLTGVPRMTIERVDLMRRFITFIDVMYEHKVKLLASAAEEPAALFDKGAPGSGAGSQRDEEFAWDRAASRLSEMSSREYVEAPWRPKSGAWLLEQARVTEIIPDNVLRALWQRYDRDANGVLDESELEELLADLNEMRRGHRNVPEEQLSSAWEMLTNRGQSGVGNAAGMGKVDVVVAGGSGGGGGGGAAAEKAPPSRRGDGFITYESFVKYGNQAFAACMLP